MLDSDFGTAPVVDVIEGVMAQRRNTSSRFRSVLCAVDFSEGSRFALCHAAALVERSGGRLQIMFVNDPLLVAAAAAAYDKTRLGEASREELEGFARAALPPRTIAALAPDYVTAMGKPAREILRAVKRSAHDTIVIGTKGMGAAERFLLGSTALELLRKATVPALAVPAPAGTSVPMAIPRDWPGGSLVAPLDLGKHLESEAREAADVARWFGASLVTVHAVRLPSFPEWLRGDVTAIVNKRRIEATNALTQLNSTLGVPSTAEVRCGDPAVEVTTVASERRAGLIVMTLRGTGGMFGGRVGSLAYQVLCQAVAPVLALPPKLREA